MKKKLNPQTADPPTGKRDEWGTMITSPNLLRALYLQTYTQRLRERDMKPELMDIFFLKSELWKSRLEELMQNKSEPWKLKELNKVLKSLKNNETKDPHGMINEIFKPGVIRPDLKNALLQLFNGMKSNLEIPDYMTLAKISSL